MNLKQTLVILSSFLVPLFIALPARADYIYGGPTSTTQIMVDKLVKNPTTGTFVDNLGPADTKFAPESEIIFKIVVKNTGNQDLSGVKVRDILPGQLDFVSGPSGSNWKKETRELTFDIGVLKAWESKEYELKTKALAKKDLPADKSVICLTNWVEAKNDSLSDSDSVGLCLSNISILPATGPDSLAVMTVILTGISGLILIKKTRLA